MNPREIVRRTIDFTGPERVARSFAPSDLMFVWSSAPTPATDWKKTGESRWERLDEWGNTWVRLDPTSKGEVGEGVLKEIADVRTYRFPDFSRPEHYADAARQRQQNPDRYVIGGLPGYTFSIARKMRKLENYLTDICTDPIGLDPAVQQIASDAFDELGIGRRYAANGRTPAGIS